ncbi:hypothetical protein K470DRAFT_294562 [Piedraia hortae CBS 480.64]|uniref:Uncharacterized protein n=1 Tax=Piedraia hortae CBS 480.64 TaxID=1314780 RepID=A0A6A7C2U6_9PEZI|nr:hypothetical protein K470DRAFT_294562 [Piedraia hortae CBS 480.64]
MPICLATCNGPALAAWRLRSRYGSIMPVVYDPLRLTSNLAGHRGRPRLHPEGDPQASSSSSVRRGPVPPLTPTRTRSTRSVEGSSREVVAIGSETAAALLDLDLIVIKCNSAFNEAAFKDVRGLHISAFATPADPESFQNLRNRLRTEREAREPAFLPPILPQGQDPFGDISPLEAERYTEGFDNHTFQWIFGPHRSSAYTLTVRVRLAKASSYFVLVTLPTFQSSLAGRSMMQPSMAQISSATPSSPAAGSPHPLSSPYAMPPWRLLPAGPLIASSSSPSSSSTAYTPLHPPAGFTRPEYQLPPIRVLGPPIRAPQPRPLDESGDEGDDRRSPKRRRVSIHDVLQRPDRER